MQRKDNRNRLIGILILVLLTLACGSADIGPTLTPDIPDAPDTSAWELALEDDFSDPDSGFHVDEYAHGRWRYNDGVYSIEVRKSEWIMHTSRGDFGDFVVEVDMRAQQPHGCAGLVLRVREEGNQYYTFNVCTDGNYSFDKLESYEDEQSEWATLHTWETSEHIRTGAATQHLRVIGVDNAFWLYANDQLLAHVEDTDAPFDQGAIGMQVTNFGGGATEANGSDEMDEMDEMDEIEETPVTYNFDNLQVYAPEASAEDEPSNEK